MVDAVLMVATRAAVNVLTMKTHEGHCKENETSKCLSFICLNLDFLFPTSAYAAVGLSAVPFTTTSQHKAFHVFILISD